MKKYSRKREAILDTLRGATVHPTAEWIYERLKPDFPELSLATVYRNLSAFVREGEIISVGVIGGQERFDADTVNHPHFVCSSCGSVLDIRPELFAEIGFPRSLEELVDLEMGTEVSGSELIFYGICASCKKEK